MVITGYSPSFGLLCDMSKLYNERSCFLHVLYGSLCRTGRVVAHPDTRLSYTMSPSWMQAVVYAKHRSGEKIEGRQIETG